MKISNAMKEKIINMLIESEQENEVDNDCCSDCCECHCNNDDYSILEPQEIANSLSKIDNDMYLRHLGEMKPVDGNGMTLKQLCDETGCLDMDHYPMMIENIVTTTKDIINPLIDSAVKYAFVAGFKYGYETHMDHHR